MGKNVMTFSPNIRPMNPCREVSPVLSRNPSETPYASPDCCCRWCCIFVHKERNL